MRVRLLVAADVDEGTQAAVVADEVKSSLESVDYVRSADVKVIRRTQTPEPARLAVSGGRRSDQPDLPASDPSSQGS